MPSLFFSVSFNSRISPVTVPLIILESILLSEVEHIFIKSVSNSSSIYYTINCIALNSNYHHSLANMWHSWHKYCSLNLSRNQTANMFLAQALPRS